MLAQQLGLPVLLYDSVTSTQDVAHEYAAHSHDDAILILADGQTAGRGRGGHKWSAPAGSGIWLTLLDRSVDRSSLDILPLRIGLGAAHALDAFTSEPVQLKWPNDLYVEQRKLAGTLIEVRWRQDTIEWVAIGFGVNITIPADQPYAAGLDAGTRRLDVLPLLVAELRTAAAAQGMLTDLELEEFNARDLARGRTCIEPVRGRVQGVTPAGELLVELADSMVRVRSGSLILE
jgi:BirA family biotin operon repressor/biotin-[acetyl-CoA-carboxylase] ligase